MKSVNIAISAEPKCDEACNFTKINTPPWVFFTFFKLHKCCQIAKSITDLSIFVMFFHFSGKTVGAVCVTSLINLHKVNLFLGKRAALHMFSKCHNVEAATSGVLQKGCS